MIHVKIPKAPTHVPLSYQWLIRGLVLIIICLAFVAGYYHSAYEGMIQKYRRLERRIETSSQLKP